MKWTELTQHKISLKMFVMMMITILKRTQYLKVKGEDYFVQKHNKYSMGYWKYP